MLNALTATRRGIRKLIVGLREGGRKGKALGRREDDGKDSKGRGAAAAAAEAEDGVWMAEVKDSGDEFGSWEGSDGDE